ncbi:MAG TPA: ABC transporter substrate-binding protein [Acidimicrobiales bacterium]|nr:ABC transporter substrate-binding protein [Acidimicrobiales bacterium]
MRRKRLNIAAGVALPIALLAGSTSAAHATSPASGRKSPAVIGAVFPLTGVHAPTGTALLDGIELAASVINKEGGVLGHPLKVDPFNTNADPVDAVTAVRQLLAVDNPSVVIGFSGSDYEQALPLVNQAKVVSFIDVGDPVLDHVTNMPYMFRAVPSDALTGTAMAYWAWHQHYTRIAMVFDADTASQTIVPSVETTARKLHIQVVASNSSDLPTGSPSYQTQVRAVLAGKPQAILTQVVENDAGTFFSELQSLGGGNLPVVGSDATATAAFSQAFGATQAREHLVSVEPGVGVGGRLGHAFVVAFTKMFHTPPRSLSSSDYDATIVAALAMDAAHSTDPRVYQRYVMKVTTPGRGVTDVNSYRQGEQLLAAGKRIKYVGLSSSMTFSKYHSLAVTYDVVKTDASGNVTVVGTIPDAKLTPLLG